MRSVQPSRCVLSLFLLLLLALNAKRHPLRLDEIHFIIMSSDEVLERALYVNHTWCSYAEARCTFASPKKICSDTFGGCLNTMLVSGRAPTDCCKQREFFCKAHRSETLNAQYRFLPALFEYRRRPEYQTAKWVVVVDDDAFVFVENLRLHLENFPSHVPLYMGEFLEGAGWSFVCGGGGSVLSRGAMDRMDLHSCIKSIHKKCMQSDWMIAECGHRHNVRFVKSHGCNSCSHITRKRAHAIIHDRLPSCHFMQQAALFIPYLEPATRRVPSIIHGYRSESDYRQVMEWFRHTDRGNGSWTYRQPAVPGQPLGDRQIVKWTPKQPAAASGSAKAQAGAGAVPVADLSDEQDRLRGTSAAQPTSDANGVASSEGREGSEPRWEGTEGLHSDNAREQEAELAKLKPF